YVSDAANTTTNAFGGGNSSNLTFTTTAADNGKFYQVVATNQYGSTTSAVAQLTVVGGGPVFSPAPPFLDLPSSSTFLRGHVIQHRSPRQRPHGNGQQPGDLDRQYRQYCVQRVPE